MTTLQRVGRAGPAVVPRSRLSGPGWQGRGQHHLGVSVLCGSAPCVGQPGVEGPTAAAHADVDVTLRKRHFLKTQ